MLKQISLLAVLALLVPAYVSCEIPEEDAMLALQQAEAAIGELQEMGFGVTYANDTLNEAKLLLSQGHYEASDALSKKVLEIKSNAIRVSGLIDIAEQRIYDLETRGYDVSDAKELFSEGISEFGVDNYADAEETILQAINRLDEIESEESLRRLENTGIYDMTYLLVDNLWIIIPAFLLFFITSVRIVSMRNRRRQRKKFERLKLEKNTIEKRLKSAQVKYFQNGSMSKTDYEMMMERHNRRITEIDMQISSLKERLSIS